MGEKSMNGKWYIGTMNDGLFIIDQPPQPAPVDYACGMNHDVNVIAAMGNDRVRAEAIVAAHNEAVANARASSIEEAASECDRFLEKLKGRDTDRADGAFVAITRLVKSIRGNK
jgi:hypothetical protein